MPSPHLESILVVFHNLARPTMTGGKRWEATCHCLHHCLQRQQQYSTDIRYARHHIQERHHEIGCQQCTRIQSRASSHRGQHSKMDHESRRHTCTITSQNHFPAQMLHNTAGCMACVQAYVRVYMCVPVNSACHSPAQMLHTVQAAQYVLSVCKLVVNGA